MVQIKYSVVIPTYNHWDLTHNRIAEMYQNHKYLDDAYEIIVVDDCSPDTDVESGTAFWKSTSLVNIRYFRNKVNIGFPGTSNVGIRLSKGNIIAVLSNDVVVRQEFLSTIGVILDKNPNALVGGRLLNYDTGWNTFPGVGTVSYLEGWLLAATRSNWFRLKGFDERFSPYDYEDIDLSLRAVSCHGMSLEALNCVGLTHLSGKTIYEVNPNRQSVTEKNRQKFIEKWGFS